MFVEFTGIVLGGLAYPVRCQKSIEPVRLMIWESISTSGKPPHDRCLAATRIGNDALRVAGSHVGARLSKQGRDRSARNDTGSYAVLR